ncbi:hypothetical protein M5D96_003544 [Drosophila gunungcola]|uniref:Uncharacterized protein n=1 Tax=Drosophila gunungcola TaxID=103775 RepID=A0A9Q0BRN6_9MUSC|nr:hypothetical protein M5D96_003544 [Drosophila gunungcola]
MRLLCQRIQILNRNRIRIRCASVRCPATTETTAIL